MKKTIGIIFGGRSGEHEVSLVSADSVIKSIDKYEVVEIGITEEGRWYFGEGCLKAFKKKNYENLTEVFISTDPEKPGLIFCEEGGNASDHFCDFKKLDIVFPVLHGPYGEDGTIQGLFEMMNIPYVGCGVLASSTAMDKLQCKAILSEAGIDVSPYIGFNRLAWEKESDKILQDAAEKIGFPCFVKPANMGSSVGISKVHEEGNLRKAIDLAARFDRRILVEKGIDAREVECSVMGNEDVRAGELGEIIVGGEFYDFYDKYVNGVSTDVVPADFPKETSDKIKEIATRSYKLLDCAGFARVDTLIDKKTGTIYVNEINTIPGFTSISLFPKMIMATGMTYDGVVEELIELGFARHKDKQKNQIKFDSGSDWYK